MKKEKLLSVVGNLSLIFLVAALMLMAGPGPVSAQDQPIKLKMSVNIGPKAGMYVRGFKPWVEMVEKATEGRVKVRIYPGGSLASLKEVYDATIKGIADVGWTANVKYPKRFPLTLAYYIPGSGIKDSIIASRIIWGLYKKFPEIRKEFEDVKVLFMHANGPLCLATNKKPVRSLADMKGMKLAGGSGVTNLWKAAGASPARIPLAKRSLSLEKGVIDGCVLNWEGHKTFGLTKVANYFTEIPATTGHPFVMFINKDKWNHLTPDIQKEIMSVSGDVGSKLFGEGDQRSSKIVMDELRAEGKEIITLTPEENAKWAELAKQFQDRQIAGLEAKGLPARAVFNEILRMVKEYQ